MRNETMGAAASDGVISTHTPGPWEWDFKFDHVRVWAGEWRDKSIVAELPHAEVFGRTKEIEANARLIAAAPDMLEALKAALHDYEMNDGLFPADEVRAAIAKATGAA